MKNSLFHGFACLPLGNWEFLKLISKLTQAVCCIVPFFIPTHPADCWYTLPLTLIVLINMKAPLPGHRTMLRVCYVLWFNQCACLLVYFNNLKKGKLKTVTNCTHKHTEQSKVQNSLKRKQKLMHWCCSKNNWIFQNLQMTETISIFLDDTGLDPKLVV